MTWKEAIKLVKNTALTYSGQVHINFSMTQIGAVRNREGCIQHRRNARSRSTPSQPNITPIFRMSLIAALGRRKKLRHPTIHSQTQFRNGVLHILHHRPCARTRRRRLVRSCKSQEGTGATVVRRYVLQGAPHGAQGLRRQRQLLHRLVPLRPSPYRMGVQGAPSVSGCLPQE